MDHMKQKKCFEYAQNIIQGPVVQSIISLTSSLRVISLTVLAVSMYNILIFFCWKNVSSYSHFFSKKFQHICVSLNVNFNKSLTNDIVSFEQLGPGLCSPFIHSIVYNDSFNEQWMPWPDFAKVLADLSLLYMCPKIRFSMARTK